MYGSLDRVLDLKCGGHADAIRALLVIQPEGVLVSLSIDMVIKIWDYTKGLVLWEVKISRIQIFSRCM